jgi:hypothetical protein
MVWPSASTVPALLMSHRRVTSLQVTVKVAVGAVLPSGSERVVTSWVIGVPARPQASLTVRVTV